MNVARCLAAALLVVAAASCKRGPKPPANLVVQVASVDESGTTLSLSFGISDKDWTDTVVAGTVAVSVLDEAGKTVCSSTIPFPATSQRSEYSGTFDVKGTFSPPCLFDRTANRRARVEFTSDQGAHVEATKTFTMYRPGDVASAYAAAQAADSASAWAAAHPPPPEPWSNELIEALLAALPPANAADAPCPDDVLAKRPRHERVGVYSIDEDELLRALGKPESAAGCHDRTMATATGKVPPLLVVERAKSCLHPKVDPSGTFDTGGYTGVAVVLDTATRKALCRAHVVATSSATAKGSGSGTEIVESDFRDQRSRRRTEALQRISQRLENPPSAVDMQETFEGRIY